MQHHALALVVVSAAFAFPATALAQTSPPAARVTNAGQASQPFVPSQPDAALTARGTCDHALTAQEAGGGPTSCPDANWPALSSDWGATLPVAGGDVLKLTIPGNPSSVGASIIDLSPPAQPVATPPPAPTPPTGGRTARRADPSAYEAASLARTDDGRWELALPATAGGFGPFDLAVAARTATGDVTYTARLTAGRKADPTQCGVVFYLPNYSQTDCAVNTPGGGVKGPPPGFGPGQLPTTTIVVAPPATPAPIAREFQIIPLAKARLGSIRFTATSTVRGRYTVSARLGGVKVSRSIKFSEAGSLAFTLKTTAAQNKRLRRALDKGKVSVKATMTGYGKTATASTTLRK